MEVHHHAHLATGETHTADPGLHRGKKKWSHYFWEFLMLFLAVFCGFLAEYGLVKKGIRRDAKKLLQQATNLLAIINKSYHLE